MYYTYMVRCIDNSIYTGITTDIERRMREHMTKTKKCARYTLNHSAQTLLAYWKSENRVNASKLEYHIKHLSKKQKEALIDKDNLEELLGKKIDYNLYKRVK